MADADLSGYSDSIPHAELVRSLFPRISDMHLLGLVKVWLEAPFGEIDVRGRRHRTTREKDEGRGSPQGSPLSPSQANVYMRRFVRSWKTLGHERRLQARIVNYADDFLICCWGTAEQAMAVMQVMMSRLRLTVKKAKTRLRRFPEESFEFLRSTIGRCHAPRTGHPHRGTRPSVKVTRRHCLEVSEWTGRRWAWISEAARIARLNRKREGWVNYFCLSQVSKAYQAVDRQICHQLSQCLRSKCQSPRLGYSQDTNKSLQERLRWGRLKGRRRRLACAKA